MNWIEQITRLPFVRGLWKRFPVGSLDLRVKWGILPRYPAYAYCVYYAAQLAARLGIPRITVIELGVAGGRGLLALEEIAEETENHFQIGIDVIGFDTGDGMPSAVDYRDLSHVWGSGFYNMDVDKLRNKLTRAKLLLGDVGKTAKQWIETGTFAPIGFVAFDLDYYSSTVKSLRLFEGSSTTHLPRVHCYFDDIIGPEFACMNDFVGELLAISEFNEQHSTRKICQIRNLRSMRKQSESWYEQIYAFHNFDHPLYVKNVMPNDNFWTQIPI